MKKNDIQQLLDRFLDGTTTLDEERRLADWFRTAAVPDEWRAYKEMFAYFDAGMPTDALSAEAPTAGQPLTVAPKGASRRTAFLRRWAVAAAVALMAGAGVWMARNARTTSPQQVATTTGRTAAVNGGSETGTLTAAVDTSAGKATAEPVESRITTEQGGGVRVIELPRDSVQTPSPGQPQRESMKYRFQPPAPKSYLAESDVKQLGDSINRQVQMLAEERLRDVELRQQAYFDAIQVASAMAVADVAVVADEEELY